MTPVLKCSLAAFVLNLELSWSNLEVIIPNTSYLFSGKECFKKKTWK